MARIRRRVGIQPPRILLPQQQSAGPALVKTASALAEMEFAKQSDLRTQEAAVAAAKINFERDGDGNLVSPSLPIGENGMIAPSIYDRTYTQMVSKRYMQQMELDTSERINDIATKHWNEPTEFREVAEAYVAKVTELAPDILKPEVNMTAQVRMVEHFNHIVRQRAEWDFNESRQTHQNVINKQFDDLHGYTVGGAGDDIEGGQMMKIRASIEEGIDLHFWNEGEAALLRESMDRQYAVASIVGEVTRLSRDPVAHREAIEKLTNFALGQGEVRMVDELGEVRMEPVANVIPNTEHRDAIAAIGIEIIKGKESARLGLVSAQDQQQNDSFDEWYLSHAMKQGDLGQPLDMDNLRSWAARADAANNEPLQQRILNIMQGEWATGASQGTAAEQRAARSMQDVKSVHERVTKDYLDRHGLSSTSELSEQELEMLNKAMWNASGPIDIPQSQANARMLSRGDDGSPSMYDAMAGFEVNFRETDLGAIQKWIDRGPAHVGVISWDMGYALNSMLQSGNADTIDRAMSIARMMSDHPVLMNNMASDTAMGRVGEAVAWLFENAGAARLDAGLVTDTLKKYNTPGYNPNVEWSGKSPEDREAIMQIVADELEGKFVSVFPSGHEVSRFSSILLRPDLGDYPAEMEQQVFNAMRARGGYLNPENGKTVRRHSNMAVQEVVEQFGWVPSKLAWTPSRFTDNRPAVHAWSQWAPEAFYKDPSGTGSDQIVMDAVTKAFQDHLDAMHLAMPEGSTKLIAGKNAFLDYNAQQTEINPAGQTHPRYNVRIMHTDEFGRIAPDDRYTEGDHFVIDFAGVAEVAQEKSLAEYRRRQQRQELLKGSSISMMESLSAGDRL